MSAPAFVYLDHTATSQRPPRAKAIARAEALSQAERAMLRELLGKIGGAD